MNTEKVKAVLRSQKFQAFDELVERIITDPNFTMIAVGSALFIIILTIGEYACFERRSHLK